MINDDMIIGAIIIIVIVGFLGSIIGSWVHTVVKRRKEYKKLDDPIEPTKIESLSAEVLGKSSEIVQEGTAKHPESRLTFFIVFKLDNGEVKKLEVGGVAFERLNVGDKGIVHIEEGRYLGFDNDKEE